MGKSVGIIAFFLLCMSPAGASGQDAASGPPRIVTADLYVASGHVMSDVKSCGLFSEQIVGTVQSGLPAVVELLFDLTNSKNKSLKRGILTFELHYDVWDDQYAIASVDSTRYFSEFEAMAKAVENIGRIVIAPLNQLDPNKNYAVHFSLAVHPLRGKEQRRIEGWLDENVRGDAQGSWRNQVVNINDLIKHFFSRNRGVANRSEWFRTQMFKANTLRTRLDKE